MLDKQKIKMQGGFIVAQYKPLSLLYVQKNEVSVRTNNIK